MSHMERKPAATFGISNKEPWINKGYHIEVSLWEAAQILGGKLFNASFQNSQKQ